MRKIFTLFCVLFIASIFAAEANAQNRKAVTGKEVTGTFRAGNGSEFKILALGKNRLRVAFSGTYEYDSQYGKMANIGTAFGIADIGGDEATFKPDETEECTITIKFLVGGKIRVAQNGTDADCGFGVNVNAGGVYKKVSGAKPKFDSEL